MNLEAIFPLLILGLFIACVAVEAARPARPMPKVTLWRLTGVLSWVMALAVSGGVPLVYAEFFAAHRLGNLTGLGTLGGALVALVVGDLLNYWVHRASHNSTFLWRAYHQLHHSAERIDVWGSAFVHPLEIAIGGVLGSLAGTVLLGVTPNAAALAGLVGIGLSTFQHMNVKTPTWLGYLVQRPEAHSVHHERGYHASNYANLPVFDILFGTFKNPKLFSADAGFYHGASYRIWEMLLGLDVSKPRVVASPASVRELGVRT